MSAPPTKRPGGPGKEEHIRALEGHGSSLGRLAADFAIFLQRGGERDRRFERKRFMCMYAGDANLRYVGVEGSMGKRQDIIKFAD
eukprot:1362077-Amorphochlora_amoeboformis.AAC.2